MAFLYNIKELYSNILSQYICVLLTKNYFIDNKKSFPNIEKVLTNKEDKYYKENIINSFKEIFK